jgi:hypothetical protein
MNIKLIRKCDLENIRDAVAHVSGFKAYDISHSTKHMYTAWAGLGMYVLRELGANLEDAGNSFSRTMASCHVAVFKVRKLIKEGDDDVFDTVEEIKEQVLSMR